jgi:Protein of unknown function (DUF2510)
MSDVPQGPRWWRAPDGKWYPPEKVPTGAMPSATQLVPPASAAGATSPSAVPPTAGEDLSAYAGLPLGWYQDSAHPDLARYWDGSALSDERRAVVRPQPSDQDEAALSSSQPDAPCVPLWPDEVHLQSDVSAVSWNQPRFLAWGIASGTPVASIAPLGYPAYVRILHPAGGGKAPSGTMPWRDVAAWSERTYHPLMQFERLSVPRSVAAGRPPFDTPPPEGQLAADPCRVLYAHLARWTSTPHTCWLGLWEGQENLAMPFRHAFTVNESHHRPPPMAPVPDHVERWMQTAGSIRRAPRFAHGGLRYLLARAPATSISTLGRPPLAVAANLAWPDDRAWYVVTDVDFDSTLVATSEECAAALLVDHGLEALPVHALDRIDIDGDVLNADAQRAR